MPAKRPSFRAAIQWIAEQDEPTYLDADEIEQESGVACALIADLWGCEPSYVAAKVAAYRNPEEAPVSAPRRLATPCGSCGTWDVHADDCAGQPGATPCDQGCGARATVYAMGRGAGDWGGRYCEGCAHALGFVITDRLDPKREAERDR